MITTISRRKLIVIAMILLVVSFSVFGLYRAALYRITKELSEFITLSEITFQDIPSERELSEELTQDQSAGSEKEERQTTPLRQDTEKPQDTVAEKPTPDDVSEDHPAIDEPAPPQTKHAIFGYMPIEDQKYLIGISNRFSLGEIKTILQSYSNGGQDWDDAKSIITGRVTPEEIQKVYYLLHEFML